MGKEPLDVEHNGNTLSNHYLLCTHYTKYGCFVKFVYLPIFSLYNFISFIKSMKNC